MWYKLVDKKPIKINEPPDFHNMNFEDEYRIAFTEAGDGHVSTVFLPFNHEWDPSKPPILFETMIFGGEYDQYKEMYHTWDEAVKGHEEAVKMLDDLFNKE